MALSEHEQRMFEELERELRGEVKQAFAPARGSRVALAVLLFVVGIGAIVAAVATQLIVVGVLGFITMLVGLVFATGGRSQGGSAPRASAKPAKPAPRPRSGSFFEDRWDRRDGN